MPGAHGSHGQANRFDDPHHFDGLDRVQRAHLDAHVRVFSNRQKVCAFLNSTSFPSLRIESTSMSFLQPVSPGHAIRALAVDHGLFPETYPRGNECSFATVLNDLELMFMLAPQEWRALAQDLTGLAADFPAREREIISQWVDSMWLLVTPSTFDATSQVDGVSDFSIGGQPIDGLGLSQPMEDLRRARFRMVASLDDLNRNERKQAIGQWLNEVCASGLPAHEQARLIGEFVPQVRGLEPAEVVESAWGQCLHGLAAIAKRQPHDPALNAHLLQIADTFPVLQKLRYPNNPMALLAEYREQMGQSGYPQVVAALYQVAARQMAATLDQNVEGISPAFNNLLRQIAQSMDAGDGVPLSQMSAVLDPAIARWTERHGHSVQTAWEAFVDLYR